MHLRKQQAIKTNVRHVTVSLFLLAVLFDQVLGATISEKAIAETQDAIVRIDCYNNNRQKIKSGHGIFIGSEGTLLTTYSLLEMVYEAMAISPKTEKAYKVQYVLAESKRSNLLKLRAMPTKSRSPDPSSEASQAVSQVDHVFSDFETSIINPGESYCLCDYNSQIHSAITGIREWTRYQKLGKILSPSALRPEVLNRPSFQHIYLTDLKSNTISEGMPALSARGRILGFYSRCLHQKIDFGIIFPIRSIQQLEDLDRPTSLHEWYMQFFRKHQQEAAQKNRHHELGANWVRAFAHQVSEGKIWDGQSLRALSDLDLDYKKLCQDRQKKRRDIIYPGRVCFESGYYAFNGHICTENELSYIQSEPQRGLETFQTLEAEGRSKNPIFTRDRNSARGIPYSGRSGRSSISRGGYGGRSSPYSRSYRANSTQNGSSVIFATPSLNQSSRSSNYVPTTIQLYELQGSHHIITFDNRIPRVQDTGKFGPCHIIRTGAYFIIKNPNGLYQKVNQYSSASRNTTKLQELFIHPNVMSTQDYYWCMYCQGLEQDLREGNILPEKQCRTCDGNGWLSCPICEGQSQVSLSGKYLKGTLDVDSTSNPFLGHETTTSKQIPCPIECLDGRIACPKCVLIGKPVYSDSFKTEYESRF